ncbi:ImmA/IrrE family metallo-endopeptidase [Leptothrix ochracea]|uniref:ImmA/IrrE family metallo-endopeptidase n=1 Tax=Leptothrix ochracea TaxID=735331 RepID=UPI0034E2B90D
MERIQAINRSRIEWCCAELGMVPEDLFGVAGVSTERWAEFWHDDVGLTFNQLRKLADYFGRGVLFFLEPGPVAPEQVHTPQFRTLAQQKPELSHRLKLLIERVERQRAVFLSLREDLDDALWTPFQAPDLPVGNVAAAARQAREWLGLGEDRHDFESYRKAVEAKGLLVFRTNGYNGPWQIAKESPVAGFALYDAQCPVIVVKKMAAEAAQAFTLMHELAHVLLHKTSWIDDDSDLRATTQGREQDANLFAGLVLVPDHFLASIKDADRPEDVAAFNEWLKPQRKAWGVSTEVILRRLLAVGRLPQATYQAYRAWSLEAGKNKKDEGGTRMYRHREPKHMFGDRFVRTVLNSLSARRITLAKASGYLDGLKITDLHELERHCAGT